MYIFIFLNTARPKKCTCAFCTANQLALNTTVKQKQHREYIPPPYLVGAAWNSHNNDVIMSAIASQITRLTSVYSIRSGADQRKHQRSRHWPLCGNSPGTGEFPAQRASNAENVPFDDVIMAYLRPQKNLVRDKDQEQPKIYQSFLVSYPIDLENLFIIGSYVYSKNINSNENINFAVWW